MTMSDFVIAVPLISILGVATSIDVVDRRIPNGLSLGGAVVGLALHAYLSGAGGFGLSLLGWGVCLGCFLPLYVGRGMAAGDVKLMAMVGAFLGPVNGFVACIFTLVAGATLASLTVACVGLLRRFTGLRWAAPANLISHDASHAHAVQKIPYAAAITLGAVAAVLQPEWLKSALPLEVLQ